MTVIQRHATCIHWLSAVVCVTALLASALAADPAASYRNVLGGEFRLPDTDATQPTVLIFIGSDCPISNSYSKEIGRLCESYTAKKVSFAVIYADPELTEEEARTHAESFGFMCPAVMDPKLTLATKVGATIKPEAAVLSAGKVVYLGRIDNRYIDFGKRREQVTSHDLRDAIDAVLAGEKVKNPRVKPIGCDIDFDSATK